MTLARHPDGHQAQSSYSVGIPAIIGSTHLTPAHSIINHFLLVPEISEVRTNHWTEFVIRALSSMLGLNRRERTKSGQYESEESFPDSCHGLAPCGRQSYFFIVAHELYQHSKTLNCTCLSAMLH